MIGKIVTVTVDRPIGSYHPVHKNLYYPINYGYVKGIIAQDGEEQDAYVIGVDVPVKEYTGKVIAVIYRNDDVEEKWVVCPEDRAFTKEEIEEIVRFQEQFFDSIVIMSVCNTNDKGIELPINVKHEETTSLYKDFTSIL